MKKSSDGSEYSFEELKFPVFKEPLPGPPVLSMEDYLKFVLWNWKHTVDREAVRKAKLEQAVDVRFELKD